MAQLAQLAQLAQASPALLQVIDKVPDCVKLTVIEEIASSRCITDISCLCTDNKFLKNLSQSILRSCKPSDQDISLHLAQGICSEKLPSMNHSRQPEIIAVLVVMSIASTLAVILRIVARNMSSAKYGLDDLFIVIALVLTYGLNANEMIALHFGFGKHQLMLSFSHMKHFLLIYYETQIILTCAITTTRLSLLFFYYRVFPIQRFRKITVITGLVIIAWWVGAFLAIIFTCVPVRAFWDRSIEGKCVDDHIQAYGITGTEVATNIAVMVLPVPWLWSLHLPTSKKFALGGIFLLGSFVCIACLIRYPFLISFHEADSSFTIVPTALWVLVECNIGIVSVCLPIMRPLFVNRSPHPVRSRFSAFQFSASRSAGNNAHAAQNLSGKTLASICMKPLPKNYSSKFGNQNSINLASQGAEQGQDDEASSPHESEPWGHDVGAPGVYHQEWQLDMLPTWTSLESGIRADGRLDKWAVL